MLLTIKPPKALIVNALPVALDTFPAKVIVCAFELVAMVVLPPSELAFTVKETLSKKLAWPPVSSKVATELVFVVAVRFAPYKVKVYVLPVIAPLRVIAPGPPIEAFEPSVTEPM